MDWAARRPRSSGAERQGGPRALHQPGLHSCPPADELLGEYAEREDILALSFPVDYWDYLGWKDTLASHENTERQRAYAAARGDGQVYTPQVVVNGTIMSSAATAGRSRRR